MRQVMRVMRRLLVVGSACALAACGDLKPATVPGLSRAVGQELPGARGLTLEDQDRIDDTVARGCATGIYPRSACGRHSAASSERRAALKAPAQKFHSEKGTS